MGDSKELSIDLKERVIDLNKSGQSLGAISSSEKIGRDGQESTQNHQEASRQA